MKKTEQMNQIQDCLDHSRCYAEISLGNLSHNLQEVKDRILPDTKLCAVIKANAYGHGAVALAKHIQSQGVDFFAVATFAEALELRLAGINEPLLVLGPSPACVGPLLVEYDISQTVSSLENARDLLAGLKDKQDQLKLHIKLNTGMNRHGFDMTSDEARQASLIAIKKLAQEKQVILEGVFTHFASASDQEDALFEDQIGNFKAGLEAFAANNIIFKITHCANSATIVNRPDLQFDMVRAGIVLYGGRDDGFMKTGIDLKPVMTFKAKISAIFSLDPGQKISYGGTFTADRPMTIGVVEAGYADGLLRNLSNRAIFSAHGQEIKQVGRICMDRCMVDLSDLASARPGDEIIIFGGEGQGFIDAGDQAKRADTISYELFSLLTPRVPRIYK